MEKRYSLGIDIGSTTIKLIVTENGNVIYEKYVRHMSRARQMAAKILGEASHLLKDAEFTAAISGSGGMGLAEAAGIPFVQEVYATGEFISRTAPDTKVVIELGGEDAKVIFFDGGIDERMNGTCAGGTGAFIDQMAVLLNMSADEMDKESLKAKEIYPIASRCGVFAKTDIQPLLNQGAAKSDVAMSIYNAVVNQTVAGLIQGRKINGKVMFLGGPLHYCMGLRKCFINTLGLDQNTAIFPEYDRFAVAIGASIFAEGGKKYTYDEFLLKLVNASGREGETHLRLKPLFESEEEYNEFKARHARAHIETKDINSYSGRAYVGIDCGSTTTKLVLISEDKEILYSFYSSNQGNPADIVKEELINIRRLCGDRIKICGSATTGYGEELILNGFHVDFGVVETIAHLTAAKHFRPDVDFIIDIGGQDIKCFKIKDGAVDSIMLNEACSSGCGSFIETFAKSMGHTAEEFAKLGIYAKSPVDLGSRCTVFMNSSVKQAQKDGATVSDISAGLSVSVVKNALYKVIRAATPDDLGKHIVVQGGTFYNDAVLRAFERETGADAVRPDIAGLMGAYGAALYSMKKKGESTLLSHEQLQCFSHTSSVTVCGGCQNHCHITINRFSDGTKYITGNRCSRGEGKSAAEENPNMFEWKRAYFEKLKPKAGKRGKIGLPLALSTYELAPLWHALFTSLGFETEFSPFGSRAIYEKGQLTIPSDTVCYPAKIMHGHVTELIDRGLDKIFYPAATYNVDEHESENHYNCPVVAYYGEVLGGNMEALSKIGLLNPYISLDSPKKLSETLYPCLSEIDKTITKQQVFAAAKEGFKAYEDYRSAVQKEGERVIKFARENGKRIMILSGRPYHIDPEISHGIDKLSASLGFCIVTEDAVSHLSDYQNVNVLNQWTFHARLYRAADYAVHHDDTELVQLVSFGCGVDAITTDEVRAILERGGKHYTQLKIDEITNLGAVKVRLRSLLGALEEEA
ncbi:MAG: 2-hydroxyacyl-CoA dehydratase [Clostridia bacterium]|nr:2-hydroxyacyl-CoA dehydratase [Clostridia bacterium]